MKLTGRVRIDAVSLAKNGRCASESLLFTSLATPDDPPREEETSFGPMTAYVSISASSIRLPDGSAKKASDSIEPYATSALLMLPRRQKPTHSGLMVIALMIGHHFSASAFTSALNASGVS